MLVPTNLSMPTLATLPTMPLRRLPSVAMIVHDVDICTAVLQAVQAAGAHMPPSSKIAAAVSILWTPNADGPFDNRFKKWAAGRANRNLKDRSVAIMDAFSSFRDDVTPYPTPLQIIARQLSDERRDAIEEDIQRRNTEQRQEQNLQAANNFREGVLGLLPPGRGTGVPSLPDANPNELHRAQSAATLLGQMTQSQNRNCEFIVIIVFSQLISLYSQSQCFSPTCSSSRTSTSAAYQRSWRSNCCWPWFW